MFDAGLADELGKGRDPFLTAGAPGPQPIEKEIHYAFAPELRTELGGCNHRFAGHGNDTVSSGDHGRDGSRSKDMDAFLLVPMPEDQILPVPRISHDSRLDDGNSSSASSPARPASIQISSCPLVRLPHSPALPPSFRLAAGHVLRSAVTSHAYRIIRSLIPASSHSPYRHPTALYLATPFPSKPLSLGPRRSGIYPSCQTGDPDMSRLSQSKCVVIKVTIHGPSWPHFLPSDPPLGELAAAHILRSYSHGHNGNPSSLGPGRSTGSCHDPSSSHVIPLLDALADDDCVYLVYPYASGGDLFDFVIKSEEGLSEETARAFFTDMVGGLRYLKSKGLAHGDVSLENVVLWEQEEAVEGGSAGGEKEEEGRPRNHRPVCRLTDLEMARSLSNASGPSVAPLGRRTVGGKKGYVAPECIFGTVVDWEAADVWSLGVSLYTMLTRHPLYTDPEDSGFELLCRGEARRMMEFYRDVYSLEISEAAVDLLAWMLAPNPAGRPRLEEVLEHAWLDGEGGGALGSTEGGGSSGAINVHRACANEEMDPLWEGMLGRRPTADKAMEEAHLDVVLEKTLTDDTMEKTLPGTPSLTWDLSSAWTPATTPGSIGSIYTSSSRSNSSSDNHGCESDHTIRSKDDVANNIFTPVLISNYEELAMGQ